TTDLTLDLGDIAAYALNRLPPLYATTEEGADYQRSRAKEELQDLIAEKVDEAIARNMKQPDFFPERQSIQKGNHDEVLGQVSSLLQTYAHKFDESAMGSAVR
ncbi:MAG: late competence development ComFB family protein, partial [Merismopedia sp. SIO2A8]|nr:late competence development ComFB family protein [Merismopedia sp. SIO2A8]